MSHRQIGPLSYITAQHTRCLLLLSTGIITLLRISYFHTYIKRIRCLNTYINRILTNHAEHELFLEYGLHKRATCTHWYVSFLRAWAAGGNTRPV